MLGFVLAVPTSISLLTAALVWRGETSVEVFDLMCVLQPRFRWGDVRPRLPARANAVGDAAPMGQTHEYNHYIMRGNNAPISLLLAASLTSAMHTSAMHTSAMHTSPSAVSVNFLRFRGGAAAVPKVVEKSIMVDDEAKLLQALRSGQISAEAICKNSDTALHLACRHGANRCLELLLAEPGFDKDCRRETDGCTPLMTCMQGGHLGCVTLLLNAGAEVNLQEFTAGTPALHYACRWGHADCLAALLRRPGVKVDLARDLDGVSALHVAAFNGQDACVTALLTARASTAQRSREHLSALDYACREGHESTTRILLDAKAPSDIGPAELGGTAPLHWAATGGPNGLAEAGHVGCLQALLEAGVHPDLLRTLIIFSPVTEESYMLALALA